jgi:hypothetical protein
MMGGFYEEKQLLDHQRSLAPLHLYTKQGDQPAKLLKKISAQLGRLNDILLQGIIEHNGIHSNDISGDDL